MLGEEVLGSVVVMLIEDGGWRVGMRLSPGLVDLADLSSARGLFLANVTQSFGSVKLRSQWM